jgi:hypothetical protein
MLRGATNVRRYRRNTSHFKFVSQRPELVIILLLQLDLGLFKLVDLVSNHLHLLDLAANLTLNLLGASILVFEFGSQRLKKFVEASVRSRHPTMGVRGSDSVVHVGPGSSDTRRYRMDGAQIQTAVN